MLQLQKIVDEISAKRKQLDDESLTKRESSNIKKTVSFLTLCARYLESDPSPEFVKKEIEKLSNKVMLINRDFGAWIPTQYYETDKEKLKAYQKEMGLKKLKDQLRALRFISNQ